MVLPNYLSVNDETLLGRSAAAGEGLVRLTTVGRSGPLRWATQRRRRLDLCVVALLRQVRAPASDSLAYKRQTDSAEPWLSDSETNKC